MKNPQRLVVLSAAVIGLTGLSGLVSITTPGVSSASTTRSSTEVRGYTLEEGRISLPGRSEEYAQADCPNGDKVVGGGGYQVTQGLGVDIASSYPFGPPGKGSGWLVNFSNRSSVSDTGVAVAICGASTSLAHYSVKLGSFATIPAEGQVQATVTCPTGTVSLGGGGIVVGSETYQAMDASAPLGTTGWRTYLSSAGSESTTGRTIVVCATKPTGWAQVSSHYVSNPAHQATNVTVNCPKDTKVLGGGPFNTSTRPTVTIGLTTSQSDLEGWHSVENNASLAKESVDQWAVCAKAAAAS